MVILTGLHLRVHAQDRNASAFQRAPREVNRDGFLLSVVGFRFLRPGGLLPLPAHGQEAQAATEEAIQLRKSETVPVDPAGTLLGFRCGCVVAPGAGDSVVFDLKVNGASVLSATVTVDENDSAYDLVDGLLSSTALVAGDVVEVEVASVTGTSAKGAFAEVDLEEAYS